MARRPALDERLVLGPRSGSPRERVFCKDLDEFLTAGAGRAAKLAKKWGLLRKGVWREPKWVSTAGAMRSIAHIRAEQQLRYDAGVRVYERKVICQRHRAKRLAIRRAGTDAEPQQGRPHSSGGERAVGEAVAETPGCQVSRYP
jgi:hypothetical protein